MRQLLDLCRCMIARLRSTALAHRLDPDSRDPDSCGPGSSDPDNRGLGSRDLDASGPVYDLERTFLYRLRR